MLEITAVVSFSNTGSITQGLDPVIVLVGQIIAPDDIKGWVGAGVGVWAGVAVGVMAVVVVAVKVGEGVKVGVGVQPAAVAEASALAVLVSEADFSVNPFAWLATIWLISSVTSSSETANSFWWPRSQPGHHLPSHPGLNDPHWTFAGEVGWHTGCIDSVEVG